MSPWWRWVWMMRRPSISHFLPSSHLHQLVQFFSSFLPPIPCECSHCLSWQSFSGNLLGPSTQDYNVSLHRPSQFVWLDSLFTKFRLDHLFLEFWYNWDRCALTRFWYISLMPRLLHACEILLSSISIYLAFHSCSHLYGRGDLWETKPPFLHLSPSLKQFAHRLYA